MTEQEMFEASFHRPTNYFQLAESRQWDIDKSLGILDWSGRMTAEETKRFKAHYAQTTVKLTPKNDKIREALQDVADTNIEGTDDVACKYILVALIHKAKEALK